MKKIKDSVIYMISTIIAIVLNIALFASQASVNPKASVCFGSFLTLVIAAFGLCVVKAAMNKERAE